jgi:ArsR family transcriptional regulator, arsenate/arsenite/antimonite-responsive transcriptional repressor
LSISICIDYDADMTRQTRPIDPDIRLLAALADPVRLDILHELAGSAEVCACDFTDCCSVSQPTVSHHLKVLREAGAVVSERRGNSIYYAIAPDLQERLRGIAHGLVPGGLITIGSFARTKPATPSAALSVDAPAN